LCLLSAKLLHMERGGGGNRTREKLTAFRELEAAIRRQRLTQLVRETVLATQFAPQGSQAE